MYVSEQTVKVTVHNVHLNDQNTPLLNFKWSFVQCTIEGGWVPDISSESFHFELCGHISQEFRSTHDGKNYLFLGCSLKGDDSSHQPRSPRTT